MKKVIIFDMDGTLWDSVDGIALSWTLGMKQLGYEGKTVTREDLSQLMGKTMDQFGLYFFPELSYDDAYANVHVLEKIENDYLAENGAELLGDVPAVWQALREQGFDIAIVSNCQSGYIEAFLDHYNWNDLVDDTECYGDTMMEKDKNIRLVVERGGYDMAFYVGDTQGDYDACKKAGVPFIFAAYGFGTVDDDVPRIDSLEALPKRMEQILQL